MDAVLSTLANAQYRRLRAYLLGRKPDANVGYSILIFHLSDAELHTGATSAIGRSMRPAIISTRNSFCSMRRSLFRREVALLRAVHGPSPRSGTRPGVSRRVRRGQPFSPCQPRFTGLLLACVHQRRPLSAPQINHVLLRVVHPIFRPRPSFRSSFPSRTRRSSVLPLAAFSRRFRESARTVGPTSSEKMLPYLTAPDSLCRAFPLEGRRCRRRDRAVKPMNSRCGRLRVNGIGEFRQTIATVVMDRLPIEVGSRRIIERRRLPSRPSEYRRPARRC